MAGPPVCVSVGWEGKICGAAWLGAGMQARCFPLEQPSARHGVKPGIKVRERRPVCVQLDRLEVIYT